MLLWFLACASAPDESELPPPLMGPTRVWAFRSTDLHTWTREEQPAAERLQSLGLALLPEGGLAVTSLDMGTLATWWERHVSGPPVRGLRLGSEGWERAEWSVEDNEARQYIDPQPFLGEMWYIYRPGEEGDPAEMGQHNEVRVEGRTWQRLPHATDPSPVRFGGQDMVFLTTSGRQIEQWSMDPPQRLQSWGGVTVPFAAEVQGELWLLAQQDQGGRRQPVVARSSDGRSFSSFRPVLDRDSVGSCTSPVLGPHPAGGWVLLCVEEPPPPRQSPSGPGGGR